MDWETWGPPIVVLGVGLVIGAVMALRARSSGGEQATVAHAAQEESLLARKLQLLKQIRELEADVGKLPEAELTLRRERLIGETSVVLEALDKLKDGPIGPMPTAAAAAGRHLGFYLVAAIGLFLMLGLGLSQTTRERGQGESITGNSQQQSALMMRAEAAKKQLEGKPDDLALLNLVTYAALLEQNPKEAMEYVDRARKVAPDDPDVQIHLGILQLMVGMNERAGASIDLALVARPNYAKALLWQGVVKVSIGDNEAAATALMAALKGDLSTEEQQIAAGYLTEAKKVPAQVRLKGTVRLAEGVTPPEGGLLFVIARRTEAAGGPPLAVRRVPAPTFPYEFQLGDEDMMLGGAWPDQVWMEARIDADGNPVTKGPEDVNSSTLGPLSSPSEGLEIVLGG